MMISTVILDIGVADAFYEGILRGLVQSWPILAALGGLIFLRVAYEITVSRRRRRRRFR